MYFNYTYVDDLEKGERQYDREYDLSTQKIVEARYVRSRHFKGNPYIEAIPKGRTVTEVIQSYNQAIMVPTQEELAGMDEYDKLDSVDLLEDFRIALPFHAMVELEFHRALRRSYKKRVLIADKDVDINITTKGKTTTVHSCLIASHISDPALGFTLLGISGCGKSTGINMMLDHYPQVIIHYPDSWHRSVQIVYLVIHCTTNNNFTVLYETIGRAIDRALGNLQPVYEDELRHSRGLGAKYAKVRELVEKFAIGVIIFDEIELMDTKSTKESSLETLLQLSNETGVAISVIGTMDAYKNLFFKRRTARRTGVLIEASKYCTNKKRFANIVGNLTMFQWGKESADYDKECIDALYRVTDGVISDLVEIYKQIQKDLIKQDKQVEITPEYIEKIADKYYKGLRMVSEKEQNLINRDTRLLVSEEIRRINSFSELVEQEELEERYDELMNDTKFKTYEVLQENVVMSIQNQYDEYNRSTIERAFNMMMAKEESLEIKLVDAVLKTKIILDKRKDDRHKGMNNVKKQKIDIEQAKKDLIDNNKREREKDK